MEEIIEKVDLLKNELDNNEIIKEIKELNKEIMKDKELLSLIEEYRLTRNEEIKEKIISNPLYSKYGHLETELNFLIMDITKELKSITGKKGCGGHENN